MARRKQGPPAKKQPRQRDVDNIPMEDVDKFHLNRERIMFDEDGEGGDRARGQPYNDDDEDAERAVFDLNLPSDSDVSSSDEDSMQDDNDDDDDDDDDEEDAELLRGNADGADADRDADVAHGWGKRRQNFYDADDTFADEDAAREEEIEAQRIRREQLSKMSEEDFLDDALGVMGSQQRKDGQVHLQLGNEEQQMLDIISKDMDMQDTEVLPSKSKKSLSRAETLAVLESQSPELINLLANYKETLEMLQLATEPVFAIASQLEDAQSPLLQFMRLKYFAQLAYVMNATFCLRMYAAGVPKQQMTIHPVFDTLVSLQNVLEDVQKVEKRKRWLMDQLTDIVSDVSELHDVAEEQGMPFSEALKQYIAARKAERKQSTRQDPVQKKAAKKAAPASSTATKSVKNSKAPAARSPVTNGSAQVPTTQGRRKREKKHKQKMPAATATATPTTMGVYEEDFKASKLRHTAMQPVGTESDYIENNRVVLPGDEGEEATRRPLRKIVQRVVALSSKKHGQAGGDDDLPKHTNGKQDRKPLALNAGLTDADLQHANEEADKFSDHEDDYDGDDLDLDDGLGDAQVKRRKTVHFADSVHAAGDNGDGEDDPLAYYNQIAAEQANHKAGKKAAYQTERATEVYGDDDDYNANDMAGGKREIGFKILKNKGLTPKRKKEQRNPRVKHRNKYEKTMKKLGTFKRLHKPLQGNYAGESTGIKTHLARSVKLQ
ncbi:something about silencing protein 10 [Sorochytrium milnesiophthora]